MFTEASQPQPHQIYYNLGWILQQQEDLEQAADRYRKAILIGRKSGQSSICADAHHNLAVVLAQQERWLAAAYHYHRSIDLRPTLLAYCNLGTALLQQGQPEAAIAVYQQATRLSAQKPSQWANLYHHLAQALQQQRRIGEAIATYHQAIAIDSNKAEIHYNLGRALHQQNRFVEAIDCFQTALRLNPDLTQAWGECGLAWLATGQIDRALHNFRQAIAPDQAFISAYCNWIRSQPVAEEFEQARSACAEFLIALQTDSQPERSLVRALLVRALTHWANVLSDYGGEVQLRYAEQLYQYALRLQPQQLELYQRLAQCLARQQRVAAAIVTCHLALAIDPQNASIQTELDRVQRSTPSARSPNAASCAGLNCEPCLQRLTLKFAPVRLSEGIYQIDSRSPAPADSIARTVTAIAEGRIWVAPQTSAWQACSALAVFSNREQVANLSRSYPGQLPICNQADAPLQGVPAALPPPLRVEGRVAALSSLSGSVYFHWMIDLLPRLEMLQQQIDLQQIDYFLVNSNQRSFQRETLQAFGIDCDRIIESDCHPHIQAEQLIIPDFVSSLGWAQPGAIAFLRKQFLPKKHQNFSLNSHQNGYGNLQRSIDRSPQDFPFIYLSRTDARYRRLLNEDQVLETLRPYGFVALTLDGLSVTEQAALFAGAEVIVAPHGSSLTNLVFCSPQTKVVELISPNYQRHYFWRISQLLNLTHYVVQGSALSCQFLRRLMYPNPLLEDIWIDVDRLDQVLEKIFFVRISTEV